MGSGPSSHQPLTIRQSYGAEKRRYLNVTYEWPVQPADATSIPTSSTSNYSPYDDLSSIYPVVSPTVPIESYRFHFSIYPRPTHSERPFPSSLPSAAGKRPPSSRASNADTHSIATTASAGSSGTTRGGTMMDPLGIHSPTTAATGPPPSASDEADLQADLDSLLASHPTAALNSSLLNNDYLNDEDGNESILDSELTYDEDDEMTDGMGGEEGKQQADQLSFDFSMLSPPPPSGLRIHSIRITFIIITSSGSLCCTDERQHTFHVPGTHLRPGKHVFDKEKPSKTFHISTKFLTASVLSELLGGNSERKRETRLKVRAEFVINSKDKGGNRAMKQKYGLI